MLAVEYAQTIPREDIVSRRKELCTDRIYVLNKVICIFKLPRRVENCFPGRGLCTDFKSLFLCLWVNCNLRQITVENTELYQGNVWSCFSCRTVTAGCCRLTAQDMAWDGDTLPQDHEPRHEVLASGARTHHEDSLHYQVCSCAVSCDHHHWIATALHPRKAIQKLLWHWENNHCQVLHYNECRND